MTVLRGSLVTLRAFRDEEFDQFWAARLRWIDDADPMGDRDAARVRARQRAQASGSWTPEGIEFAISEGERLVGGIQARTHPSVMPPAVLEIGVELYEQADRGRRLGTEAIQLLTTHLFELREAQRVQLGTAPDNLAMQRVAERLGFQLEGVMRGFMPSSDGYEDQLLYAMTKSDYQDAKVTWTSTS
jgi:RimJ/RimL family protein N-acetyltransferase